MVSESERTTKAIATYGAYDPFIEERTPIIASICLTPVKYNYSTGAYESDEYARDYFEGVYSWGTGKVGSVTGTAVNYKKSKFGSGVNAFIIWINYSTPVGSSGTVLRDPWGSTNIPSGPDYNLNPELELLVPLTSSYHFEISTVASDRLTYSNFADIRLG